MRRSIALSIVFLLAIAPFLPRQIALWAGERKALEIIGPDVGAADGSQPVLAVARWISAKYVSGNQEVYPAYYRYIPYVTNQRIPELLRIPPGAIEFLFGDGVCDSAARALGFILESLGYEAEQINLITTRGAHTGLGVTMPAGKQVFVDPYYGLAARGNGGLDTLDSMISALKSGREVLSVTVTLRDKPILDFYETFRDESIFVAEQGRDAGIEVDIPATQGRSLLVGKQDGRYEDVVADSLRHGMTPYFHYLGSRYDRAWTRTLRAREDVRVEFVMSGPVNGELVFSSPPPEIDGNVVAWSLKAQDKLVLQDNRTPLQIFGPNFQNIDAIRIVPRGGR